MEKETTVPDTAETPTVHARWKWKNRKEIAFFFEKIEIAFLTILTLSKKEFRKKNKERRWTLLTETFLIENLQDKRYWKFGTNQRRICNRPENLAPIAQDGPSLKYTRSIKNMIRSFQQTVRGSKKKPTD